MTKGATMSIYESIQHDLTQAMKAREKERLDTLRMMKSALKLEEIEAQGALDDAATCKVLLRLCKQRKESIEQFERGGRTELADRERAELAIIEAYLPKAPDEAAIKDAVAAAAERLGASSPKDMGAVIKAVMAHFAGQPVDGKRVSELVKERLGS